MTYNVRGCVGTDGQRSESRIAEVIAATGADVVGLQELDLGRRRSAGVDQAGLIAAQLGWECRFFPAMRREEEQYGDAILSRFPMTLRQAAELPARPSRLCPESRAAIWVEVETPRSAVHVINTHLGLGRRERLNQARLLAGREWLGRVPAAEPLILMGDFNSLPRSAVCRVLAQHLREVRSLSHSRRRASTYPTFFPLFALDHIFLNNRLTLHNAEVIRTPLSRHASDHFPLMATLAVETHCLSDFTELSS